MSPGAQFRVRRADFFRARNYVAARVLDSAGSILARSVDVSREGLRRPVQEILCLALDRLGDILMVTPAFRALRQNYRRARITVAVPSAATELIVNRPEVDELVRLDPPWLGEKTGPSGRGGLTRLVRQVRALRRRNFDLSVSFHPDPRGHFIQRIIGARCRIAPAYKGGGWLLTGPVDTSPHVHILERVRAVLRSLGWSGPLAPPDFPLSEEARQRARQFFASCGLTSGRGAVALAPGARDPAKLWTPEAWGRLADGIAALEGRPAVLVGGPQDLAWCDRIKAVAKRPLVDATARGLVETAALLELCRVVVTVDSMTRHLAAAVGAPVVVLQYGGERPQTWAAYGSHHLVVRKDVPCSPCGRIVCPRPTHDCMEAITPEEILALLSEEPSGAEGLREACP